MELNSKNFSFLKTHDALLVRLGAEAEHYLFTDPNVCLIKLRQFGEVLAQRVAAHVGVYTSEQDDQLNRLGALRDRGALTPEVASLFHGLRKAGNEAVHAHKGTREEASHQLKMARTLGVWFHKSFKDPSFQAGPFAQLTDPRRHEKAFAEEAERLRQELEASRQEMETARRAAEDEGRLRAEAEAVG